MKKQPSLARGVSARPSTNKGFFNKLLNGNNRIAAAAIGVGALVSGCLEETNDSDEKIGTVQQAQWKATSFTPSWGQSASNNGAPKVYWKTPTDGIAVFASDKGGGTDIYISSTSAGPTGPWSPETLIDDSGSVMKVNMLAPTDSERGAVICVGGGCATGKLIFSSDRDGSDDIFWGDFDTTTLAVTNVSKLPVGVTKVNGNATGEMYPTVDFSGNKLFFNRGPQIYTADIGVWDKLPLTGAVGSLNEGASVYETYLIATNDSGCANVSSSFDACRYDLLGTTLSTPTNANSIVGTLAAPNDAQEQFHPYVDSQGYLWVSTGTVGNRIIKAYEPVSGSTPDAGTDGGGGEGGSGGSDSGAGGSGGESGTGGADAGAPDVDAGMDAAPDAPDDVMDAGVDAPDDVMEAGTDASVDSGMDASADAGDAGEGGADSGPTDAGMPDADASTPDAGEDAGMDAGPDAADSGPDASTDAGEGGADAGPKPDCKAKVTGPLAVESCDDISATIKVNGLGSISYKDDTTDITANIAEVVGDSCTYKFEFPDTFKLISGFCAKDIQEPSSSTTKYVDYEFGITTGSAGSHKSTTFPDAFNPNKKKGVVDIVAFKAVESTHHLFKADGCDSHNLNACTPISTNLDGAAQKNDIPEGSTLYLQISSGELSGNPNDFAGAPSAAPVETANDGGGCAVSPEKVSHDTKNALVAAVGLILMAAARRGSRKEEKQ